MALLKYKGKREDISLREKEAQIKKDLDDGIDTEGVSSAASDVYKRQEEQPEKEHQARYGKRTTVSERTRLNLS